MEGIEGLSPYTAEQITKGEKLPDRLSSINHDIGVGEKLKLDVVTEQISKVAGSIREKTDRRFVILGSMGMYARLNELRQNGSQLMILEQRIAGGKNDYDVGFHPEDLPKAMSDFGWDEQTKQLGRGYVGKDYQMVDTMARTELPHFQWQATEINNTTLLVQTPEEMVFEKMNALINPGVEDNGEQRIREVKWGVDIKLLKAYLVMKNGWTDAQVEAHLSQRWEDFIEDSRYQGIADLSTRIDSGEPVLNVVKGVLTERLGHEVTDVGLELDKLFGIPGKEQIAALLTANSGKEFNEHLKSLIDIRSGGRLTYQQASEKANQEYQVLLSQGTK